MPEGNIQWTERPSKQIIAREFTIAAAAVPYPPLPPPPPPIPPSPGSARLSAREKPPGKAGRQADRPTGLGSAWPWGEEG